MACSPVPKGLFTAWWVLALDTAGIVVLYLIDNPAWIGFLFSWTGIVLNRLVIHANGGRMPVLDLYWPEGHEFFCARHSLANDRTRYAWAIDCLPSRGGAKSVGDVLIDIGSVSAVLLCVLYLIALTSGLFW